MAGHKVSYQKDWFLVGFFPFSRRQKVGRNELVVRLGRLVSRGWGALRPAGLPEITRPFESPPKGPWVRFLFFFTHLHPLGTVKATS